MFRHLKVSPKLFLIEQTIPVKQSKKSQDAINHIWIYDRSGSMASVLKGLAKDLIKRARSIPKGDTITLGWFSSEGEFNFMLKGFKISDNSDYSVLERTILNNSSPIGCTCFSEILADTKTVVKDLSNITDKFALCFFTDGYPVVSNYPKEIKSIYSAIDDIKGSITASLMVGYGNYYNKELMSSMAERIGGSLCHSESLPQFSISLDSFVSGSRGQNRMEVEIDVDNPLAAFTLSGDQINVYATDKAKIGIAVPNKDEAKIYYLSTTFANGSVEEKLNDSNVKSDDSLVRGAYAAAYVLTQRAKTDLALEVLASLGDVELIEVVNNAFTNSEYGNAENRIQQAINEPKKRFAKGRNTKYLPSADAFCLLDLLDILMADNEAYFYPCDDRFDYKKITTGSKTVGSYPDFKADKSAKCAFNKLNWNDSKLNLSILAKIEGTIQLKDGHKKYGFIKEYPTSVWRNYTLVKDGFLNVKELPISTSKETMNKLQTLGLISEGGSSVYMVDFTKIPIINRVIADGKTSATELCKKVWEETELEAGLKVYKHFLKKFDLGGNDGMFSDEAIAFLEGNGIRKDGSFSPPSEKVPSIDYYMAKEFEIKIKGYSSLPKVDDVISKLASGKDLTGPAKLMKVAVEYCDNSGNSKSNIENGVKSLTAKLNKVRSDIQKTKFAIILAKKWFDEFTSRENNVLKVDGNEFTISVREVKVEI